MKTLCLLAGLWCSVASAGQLSLSFGPSLDGQLGVRKQLTAAYELRWGAPSVEVEAGGWNEPNCANVYGGANFGVDVIAQSGIAVRVSLGPVVSSQTDDRVSSNVNAELKVRVGADMKDWFAGAEFSHKSNAGLKPPNLGLDFIGLCVGIPL